jgi:hypothetical protein
MVGGTNVEECMGSRLVEVEGGVGLGVEDVLCFQLQEAVGEEQSRLVVIRLREMRCDAMLALRLRTILRLVAGVVAVEAGVVAVHLVLVACTTSLLSLPAAATVATLTLGLMLPTTAGASVVFLGRAGRAGAVSSLLLLLLPSEPLLLGVHQLPTNGNRLGQSFFLKIVHHLQPSGDLLNGEVLEVEEGLDRNLQLGVLLRRGLK